MSEISGSQFPDTAGGLPLIGASNLAEVRTLICYIVNQLPEPEREVLTAQAMSMSGVSGNLGFVSYAVDKGSTTPSPQTANPIVVRPEVLGEAGESTGVVMAWLDSEGYLDSLEYTWWALESPRRLPVISELRERSV